MSVLLDIDALRMEFPVRRGRLGRRAGALRAVDGVSLSIAAGEIVGLVGESGCGKSTLGRCISRVYRPTGGTMRYHRDDGRTVQLATAGERELRPLWREIRMVLQDPYSSLNPRMTLRDIIAEPLRAHDRMRGRECDRRVGELLERVGLHAHYMSRYPHAFSGGERQRVAIARALALQPRLVIADEPVSALDVSVRAQIINLLGDLQDELGLTYLFISHDLSVVEHLCQRVAVMYLGRLVEIADTAALFHRPQHPYTEALLAAVPVMHPRDRAAPQRAEPIGDGPDPARPPTGCRFHPRCPYAQPRCRVETPRLREIAPGRLTACHRAAELSLTGRDPAPPTGPPGSTDRSG